MCIFTSDKDIPSHVRLTTRTIQYLIIPLLSLSLLTVGLLHIDDCTAQPLLPVWHVVAGSTGLVVPLLYLLFDDLNPALAKTCPGLSEALDNIVVFVLPVYILFEICWLLTGTVWVGEIDRTNDTSCKTTIYMFSLVVMVNFWIHILTPLFFMMILCCSKVGLCNLSTSVWGFINNAVDHWTRIVRLGICLVISVPLGGSMLGVGVNSLLTCSQEITKNYEISTEDGNKTKDIELSDFSTELPRIPTWLLVAGVLVLLGPLVYLIYDVFCKPEDVNLGVKNLCQALVILYLLAGLALAVLGFLWIFGDQPSSNQCGHNEYTYWFAFSCLIILNGLMDAWICFKICVILYWALIFETE